MPISQDKTRIIVSIEKEDKKQLEERAKKENRSLNNLIVTILRDYLENA